METLSQKKVSSTGLPGKNKLNNNSSTLDGKKETRSSWKSVGLLSRASISLITLILGGHFLLVSAGIIRTPSLLSRMHPAVKRYEVSLYPMSSYLRGFIMVTMANCIKPVNWKSCQNPHEWILPDLILGVKLLTGYETPYQSEREYLENK
jgi:hypothetical protein